MSVGMVAWARWQAALLTVVWICAAAGSRAQAPGPDPEKELQAAWQAAAKVAVHGPSAVTLLDQGAFAVPQGVAYIPMPEAGQVMRAFGNRVGPKLIGMAVGTGTDEEWLATVSFFDEGYIKDDDAKSWDAEELLAGLKEGTEDANKDRRARGIPALTILGWAEKPAYDAATHKLVWSIDAKSEGVPDQADHTINYNTYLLGREGYLSLNFVTTGKLIEAQKPIVQGMLAGLSFAPGKSYDDFDASTDKVAAYGLAALVGGAVLKKVGFFAIIAAFVAKFAKAGLLLLLPLAYGVQRFIRRKPKPNA